jgi:hypothetical protein
MVNFASNKYIALRALAPEVFKLTGVTRAPSTMISWARYGKSNRHGRLVKLKFVRRLGTKYSTVEWLRKFIREVSV